MFTRRRVALLFGVLLVACGTPTTTTTTPPSPTRTAVPPAGTLTVAGADNLSYTLTVTPHTLCGLGPQATAWYAEATGPGQVHVSIFLPGLSPGSQLAVAAPSEGSVEISGVGHGTGTIAVTTGNAQVSDDQLSVQLSAQATSTRGTRDTVNLSLTCPPEAAPPTVPPSFTDAQIRQAVLAYRACPDRQIDELHDVLAGKMGLAGYQGLGTEVDAHPPALWVLKAGFGDPRSPKLVIFDYHSDGSVTAENPAAQDILSTLKAECQ